ncbi:MAG: hypothetical protein ABJP06_02145 [Sulfitobacter sp.]
MSNATNSAQHNCAAIAGSSRNVDLNAGVNAFVEKRKPERVNQ